MAYGKLILKDGTEYADSDCGYAGGFLWCWTSSTSFPQVFADFSDPSKTEEIRWIHGNKETVYYGFTEIDTIRRGENEPGVFTIDVRMNGEDVRSEEHDLPENIE